MAGELVQRTEARGWRPRFMQEIAAYADASAIEQGVHDLLARDNVAIETVGDTDQLAAHQGGILFVGNHQHQWEFVGAMALTHRLARANMRHVAKFYVQRQIRQALGASAAAYILPVYPRILASDRGEWRNSETLNRLVYRRALLSETESAAVNERSLIAAADHLAADGVVNIFPCGSVVDWQTHPWRSGVGRIIGALSDEAVADTLVVPYQLDDVARRRLLAAVAFRGRGRKARPQTMTVRIGTACPVAELAEDVRVLPDAITARLREHCLAPETWKSAYAGFGASEGTL